MRLSFLQISLNCLLKLITKVSYAEVLRELEIVEDLLTGNTILPEAKMRPEEHQMAEGEDIMGILSALIGENAHVLHPNVGSIYNIFSTNKEVRIEAAEQLALEINQFITDRIPKHGKGTTKRIVKPLSKPIVAIMNTEGKQKSNMPTTRIDANEILGSHWISIVILPKDYKPLCNLNQKYGTKDYEQLFLYDSLTTNRKVPEEIIQIFKYGGERKMAIDEKRSEDSDDYKIFPCLDPHKAQIKMNTNGKQQGRDFHCGYWAIYNAVMTLITGSDDWIISEKNITTIESSR